MKMEQGARIIVERWLQAKPDDVLHFITDETKLREMEAFSAAAEGCGAVPKVSVLPSDSVQSGDSIEEMRHIMSYANAIVGATNYSFITTNAVTYALRHGARFLSLPLSTNDGSSLLEQDFLQMDPRKAARLARPLLGKLRGAKTLHVTTALGTDITFSVQGRKAGLFRGTAARPGVCASASFEVYVPPVETSASGRVVLDGSMGYIGLVQKPLELEFDCGRLTRIADTPDGRRLRTFIEQFEDPAMYCAAEFGIGLNQYSRCRGASYIEDESAYGTFHIGFGRNLALGGTHDAAGHFDIVIHDPTITADGVLMMKQGDVCTNPIYRFLYL
ncbi:MAG: peptidase [Eubacteriales bacterium]|nr:peptidase [Eubacteriales bacterium]